MAQANENIVDARFLARLADSVRCGGWTLGEVAEMARTYGVTVSEILRAAGY